MKLVALVALISAGCGSDATVDPGWMTPIGDEHSLAELSIPGTHESAALYEPLNSGTAKCQNLPIDTQLEAGVRFLDIRCRHVNDGFAIYHGPVSELQTFDDVLATVFAFLDEHPSQTVIMSVKEEFTPEGNTRSFNETFEAYAALEPLRWHLGPTIPTLGDVRGKIVLLRRFASTTTPLGIDASSMWLEDSTFTIKATDTTLRVQDDFKVDTNDEKWMAITSLLAETKTGAATTWFLDYTSGFQTKNGLPNTPVVATDINARIDTWLTDPANADGRLGTLAMDFTTESRIRRVIEHNSALISADQPK